MWAVPWVPMGLRGPEVGGVGSLGPPKGCPGVLPCLGVVPQLGVFRCCLDVVGHHWVSLGAVELSLDAVGVVGGWLVVVGECGRVVTPCHTVVISCM